MAKFFWIDTRDKPGLLIAAMRELKGTAHISFEGSLQKTGLGKIPGASAAEAPGLSRAALKPVTDFLVLPLTDETIPAIQRIVTKKKALTDWTGIAHVQIAVDGCLVFGAYDNFHRNCVVAYERFPIALLRSLQANGVIRSFEPDIVQWRCSAADSPQN